MVLFSFAYCMLFFNASFFCYIEYMLEVSFYIKLIKIEVVSICIVVWI
jgi:hypothetical protein